MCPGERRLEVFFAFLRTGDIPLAGVVRVQKDHCEDGRPDHDRIRQSDFPLDLRPDQPVQPVQPGADARTGHVQPVDDISGGGILQIKDTGNTNQQEPRNQHGKAHGKQSVANADRPAVSASPRVSHVEHAEHQKRNDQQQSQHQVPEKHHEVEVVLVRLARDPAHGRDAGQVTGIGTQQRHQCEDNIQQLPQARSHGAADASSGWSRNGWQGGLIGRSLWLAQGNWLLFRSGHDADPQTI